MQLSNESKDRIRNEIEKLLKDVPEGNRVKLNKELLEDLIFTVSSDEKNTKLKFIVWHGDFLSKIDLSEVSFDDVEWNLEDAILYKYCSNFDYDCLNLPINLSNTNINVDFNNAYSFYGDYLEISCVNFSNTDLSKCPPIYNADIKKTDLSGTNIKFEKGGRLYFFKTDLTGVDFSKFHLKGENFEGENYEIIDEIGILVNDCNFKNTGLNIVCSKDDKYFSNGRNNFGGEAYDRFMSMLNDGKLEGCYVNGNLVLSLKSEEEILSSVISSIEEQKKKFR